MYAERVKDHTASAWKRKSFMELEGNGETPLPISLPLSLTRGAVPVQLALNKSVWSFTTPADT